MVKFNNYGGQWTVRKLEALDKYLDAYLTVLQAQPFSLVYIDAFAGPGFWRQHNNNPSEQLSHDLEYDEYRKGSPLIALEASSAKSGRAFDQFYFIDKYDHIHDLEERVREKHSEKLDKVKFIQDDANTVVQNLCEALDWKSSRAVLFLDPFGMEVKWETIEAIAKTKAIDLWVLFPLGVAVNRMITRDGNIPADWDKKLCDLFGDNDWRKDFYQIQSTKQLDLLTVEAKNFMQKTATFEDIANYFIRRLKTVFADVLDPPMMLKNSTNNPIFSLCFAAGNEKGARIAIKIANNIVK